MWSVILFIAPMLLGIGINAWVFYVVLTRSKKKRKRPSRVLIAHMCCVAICITCMIGIKTVDSFHVVSLRAPGLCETLSVLRKIALGAFSMNVFAIVFERFQTFRSLNHGSIPLGKLICCIWGIAAIVASPSIFMVKYTESSESSSNFTMGTCKNKHLFDSMVWTLIYESVYLIVFHLSPVFYMIYGICKIWTALKDLHLTKSIPDKTTWRKVRKRRYIFCHFISFCCMWVPYGVLQLIGRIFRIMYGENAGIFMRISTLFVIILNTYIVVNPLIYLWLMSAKKSLRFESSRTSTSQSGRQRRDHASSDGNEDSRKEHMVNPMRRSQTTSDAIQLTTFVPPAASMSKLVTSELCSTTSV